MNYFFKTSKITRFQNATLKLISCGFLWFTGISCQTTTKAIDSYPIGLVILDPGHFHAALVQKSMYDEINPLVHVYAPEGPDVESYSSLVKSYNTRTEVPTNWKEERYTREDYFEKMLTEKEGNVVLIAGNNRKKTEYIKRSVDAGFHVLADKPMAKDTQGFNLLKEAFTSAERNKVLLFDVMTERYEIINILQKELLQSPEIFGKLEAGSPEDPAIIKESVHHFFKTVSGAPLVRPAWFFDVDQAGDGLVDVTTHMVDIIQWKCFPGVSLDYNKDIRMISARRFATPIKPSQFKQVTKIETFPDYLLKDVKDSILNVYSNGEMNYTIKGIHSKVSVTWNFQAPEGAGDTHFSIIRGSMANIVVRQGKEQNYMATLYIEPVNQDILKYEQLLIPAFENITKIYSGLTLKKSEKGWEIIVPQSYKIGHEAHFAEVTKKFLQYLKEGKMAEWEVPNMLAKYYTTTQALEKAAAR